MFTFFLKSYRVGLLDFCGSSVDVKFDPNGKDSKVSFKEFDNGLMKIGDLSSCHPNTLKGVIVGKKSWGLWLQEWTDGIVSGDFSEKEIKKRYTYLYLFLKSNAGPYKISPKARAAKSNLVEYALE